MPTRVAVVLEADIKDGGRFRATLEYQLSDHGKIDSIEVPSDAKSLVR